MPTATERRPDKGNVAAAGFMAHVTPQPRDIIRIIWDCATRHMHLLGRAIAEPLTVGGAVFPLSATS